MKYKGEIIKYKGRYFDDKVSDVMAIHIAQFLKTHTVADFMVILHQVLVTNFEDKENEK